MFVRRTVSISLSPELHGVAERMPASGRDGTVREVVRAGLRLPDERALSFQDHRLPRSEATAESVVREPSSA